MYIYTPNFDRFSQKLTEATGIICSSTLLDGEIPIVTLLVKKSKAGGVDRLEEYISDGIRTIVIPGRSNDAGFAFAEEAVALGVPEENLLFVPDNQGLNMGQIAKAIVTLANNHPFIEPEPVAPDEEDDFFGEKTINTQQPTNGSSRVKTLAFISSRGGTGKTTVLTSLAAHYKFSNQTVAILDLGSPTAAIHHTQGEVSEGENWRIYDTAIGDIYSPMTIVYNISAESISVLLNELKVKYRRVLIDLPTEIPQGFWEVINADKAIIVMDSDIVQSVEPFGELQEDVIFVYNKAVAEVDAEVVKSFVGEPLITIKADIEGSQAGLDALEPAYSKSDAISMAIGELAASID